MKNLIPNKDEMRMGFANAISFVIVVAVLWIVVGLVHVASFGLGYGHYGSMGYGGQTRMMGRGNWGGGSGMMNRGYGNQNQYISPDDGAPVPGDDASSTNQ